MEPTKRILKALTAADVRTAGGYITAAWSLYNDEQRPKDSRAIVWASMGAIAIAMIEQRAYGDGDVNDIAEGLKALIARELERREQ